MIAQSSFAYDEAQMLAGIAAYQREQAQRAAEAKRHPRADTDAAIALICSLLQVESGDILSHDLKRPFVRTQHLALLLFRHYGYTAKETAAVFEVSPASVQYGVTCAHRLMELDPAADAHARNLIARMHEPSTKEEGPKVQCRPMPYRMRPLIDALLAELGVAYSDMAGRFRERSLVRARHMAFWLLRHQGFLQKDIAAAFAMDHATVHYGLACADREMAAGGHFRKQALAVLARRVNNESVAKPQALAGMSAKGSLVVQAISRLLQVDQNDMLSHVRRPAFVRARYMAFWLLRCHGYSQERIGNIFGVDHSSVCHGQQRAEAFLATDVPFQTQAAALLAEFGLHHEEDLPACPGDANSTHVHQANVSAVKSDSVPTSAGEPTIESACAPSASVSSPSLLACSASMRKRPARAQTAAATASANAAGRSSLERSRA
jgi:hypothetical protein